MADRDAAFLDEDDVVELEELGEEDVSRLVAEMGGGRAGAGAGAGEEDEEGGMAAEEVTEQALGDEADALLSAPKGKDTAHQVFVGHTSSVYAVAVSVDGATLASGSGDDSVRVWDTATGACRQTLTGHGDSVTCVRFNQDGTLLATASLDGAIRVWRQGAPTVGASGEAAAPGWEMAHLIEGPTSDVEWMEWHPKGNVLLAGSSDSTAWMWHATGDKVTTMAVFAGHTGSVTCGAFSGSGKTVVTGSDDCTVRVWNPKTSACITTFEGRDFHEGPINCLACAVASPLLLTGGHDGTARLSNMATGKVLAVLKHGRLGNRVDADVGGSAGVDVVGTRTRINASTATVPMRRGDGTDGMEDVDDIVEEEEDVYPSVEAVAFGVSETHPYAASGATDGSVIVWDLATFTMRHALWADDSIIRMVWWPRPALPLLCASTADGEVAVWDARNGARVASLTGHAGLVLDLAVYPAADTGSAGADATVVVYTAGDDATCRAYRMDGDGKGLSSARAAAPRGAGIAAPIATADADAPFTAPPTA